MLKAQVLGSQPKPLSLTQAILTIHLTDVHPMNYTTLRERTAQLQLLSAALKFEFSPQ
jgi:hypothetical protein